MQIYLATDHAGFELKEQVKAHLKSLGYKVSDEGAFQLNPTDDYPDFIKIVAKEVASNPDENRGIIFGYSGQGEAMTANRFTGVRAAVYDGGPDEIIRLSRQHNNANVLSIGSRFVTAEQAMSAVALWLTTDFDPDPRHVRRITKIDAVNSEIPEF